MSILRIVFFFAMLCSFVLGIGCGIWQHWQPGTYFLVLSIVFGKILFGKVND